MQNQPTRPQPRSSPLAIWSLVLGILSMLGCVCITGVPAVILGIMALNRIKKSSGQTGGQGLAIAGLITGGIGTLLTVVAFIMASLALPAIGSVRSRAQATVCMHNVRQLTMGCMAYAQDHDQRLPEKLEDLKLYLGTRGPEWPPECICPAAKDKTTPSYELLNGGRRTSKWDAARTVIIREEEPNHLGRRTVGYLDGHVESRRE